jgi:hypothetical protein
MNNKKIVKHTYKLKRGNEDILQELNPMLLEGEPIVIFNNDGSTSIKIGDGIHSYCDLKTINVSIEVINEITDNMSDDSIASAKAIYNYVRKYVDDSLKDIDIDIEVLNEITDNMPDDSIASAKAIYNYVRQYVDTSLKDIDIEDKIKQSDYCENDVNDLAYIKNRLFWKDDDKQITDIVPLQLNKFINITENSFVGINYDNINSLYDIYSDDFQSNLQVSPVVYSGRNIYTFSPRNIYGLEFNIVNIDKDGSKEVLSRRNISGIRMVGSETDSDNNALMHLMGSYSAMYGYVGTDDVELIESILDQNNTNRDISIMCIETDISGEPIQLIVPTISLDFSEIPVHMDNKLGVNSFYAEWRLYCEDNIAIIDDNYYSEVLGEETSYDEDTTYYRREEIFEPVEDITTTYDRDTLYYTYDEDTKCYVKTPYLSENSKITVVAPQSCDESYGYTDYAYADYEYYESKLVVNNSVLYDVYYTIFGSEETYTISNIPIKLIPYGDYSRMAYIGNPYLLEKRYSITVPEGLDIPTGCEHMVIAITSYDTEFTDLYSYLRVIVDSVFMESHNINEDSEVLLKLTRTPIDTEINNDKQFFVRKFTENMIEDKTINEDSIGLVYTKPTNSHIVPISSTQFVNYIDKERQYTFINPEYDTTVSVVAADYSYVMVELDGSGTNFDETVTYYEYDDDYQRFFEVEIDDMTSGLFFVKGPAQYTEISIPTKDISNDVLESLIFYKLEDNEYIKVDESIINDEDHKCTLYTRGELHIKNAEFLKAPMDYPFYYIGNSMLMDSGSKYLIDYVLVFTNDYYNEEDTQLMLYHITPQLTDYTTTIYSNKEHTFEGKIHKLGAKYIDNVQIKLTQEIDSDSTTKQVASAAAIYEALEERGEFNRIDVYNNSDEYPSSSAVYNFAEQKKNKLYSYEFLENFSSDTNRYPSTKHVYDYVEKRINNVVSDYSDLLNLIGSGN